MHSHWHWHVSKRWTVCWNTFRFAGRNLAALGAVHHRMGGVEAPQSDRQALIWSKWWKFDWSNSKWRQTPVPTACSDWQHNCFTTTCTICLSLEMSTQRRIGAIHFLRSGHRQYQCHVWADRLSVPKVVRFVKRVYLLVVSPNARWISQQHTHTCMYRYKAMPRSNVWVGTWLSSTRVLHVYEGHLSLYFNSVEEPCISLVCWCECTFEHIDVIPTPESK